MNMSISLFGSGGYFHIWISFRKQIVLSITIDSLFVELVVFNKKVVEKWF